MRNSPNKIILHHSATNGGTFEGIRRYHMRNRGFIDIGYHYLLEKDGSLHKGRNETIHGAHTIGQNRSSIGICLVGNFDKYIPTDNQMVALKALIRNIYNRYGRLPIYGHNKFSLKTCPGTRFPMAELLENINTSQFK